MHALFLLGANGSGKDAVLRGTVLNTAKLTELSLPRLLEAVRSKSALACVDEGHDLVVNGNADDLQKIMTAKAVLEACGYKTGCLYVYTTDEESKKRNDQRARLGARTFSEEVRSKKYQAAFQNIAPLREAFSSFTLFDNSFNPAMLDEETKAEVAGWITELNATIVAFYKGEESVDEQVESFLDESLTGSTRMQIQAHWDRLEHLRHADRVQQVERAHNIHSLKVNSNGVVVHYVHAPNMLLRRQAEGVVHEDKRSETGAHQALAQGARADTVKKVDVTGTHRGLSDYYSHNDTSVAKQVAQKRFDNASKERTNNSGTQVKSSPQPVVTGPSHLSGKSKVNEDVTSSTGPKKTKTTSKKAARAPVQLGDIRQGDGMSATSTFAAEDLGGGTVPNSTFTQVAKAAAGHPQAMKKPKSLKKLKEELGTKSPDAEFPPAPEVYEDWGVESEEAMFEGRAIKTNKPFKEAGRYAVYVTDGRVVNRLTFNKKAGVLSEEVALTDTRFWETLR